LWPKVASHIDAASVRFGLSLLWEINFERLISPKKTLINVSQAAENVKQRTPRISRGAAKPNYQTQT
jgi:hypothetical protein